MKHCNEIMHFHNKMALISLEKFQAAKCNLGAFEFRASFRLPLHFGWFPDLVISDGNKFCVRHDIDRERKLVWTRWNCVMALSKPVRPNTMNLGVVVFLT